MLGFLKKLFGDDRPVRSGARSRSIRSRSGALLVEAALVDGVYANLESDMIAEISGDQFWHGRHAGR